MTPRDISTVRSLSYADQEDFSDQFFPIKAAVRFLESSVLLTGTLSLTA